jgi:hypothetical protein
LLCTNPPGVSLNRLELKKQMRYFFRAKTFCVLQKICLGKNFRLRGREWPTIHEPNNLQMAPHRYRGRTAHRGTQNRRRVRFDFDFEPPRVTKLALFTFCVDAGAFRIVAGHSARPPSGSGSYQRARVRVMHRPSNARPCSELPGISWRLQMQNLAHFAILTRPGPPPTPHPHPFPAQTTRQLTMEVATTSQMLFCNTIFEWFLAKYSIWLCTGFSVAQNGHFLWQGASTI